MIQAARHSCTVGGGKFNPAEERPQFMTTEPAVMSEPVPPPAAENKASDGSSTNGDQSQDNNVPAPPGGDAKKEDAAGFDLRGLGSLRASPFSLP